MSQLPPPVAPPPAATPGAVIWFRVYCALMAFIYLLTMGISAIFFIFDPEDLEMTRIEAYLMGGLLGGLGFVLLLMYLAPFILPRRPWVWVYDVVLIGIGFTSCLTLPFALPLLLYWLKPEAKGYFGKV